MFKSLLTVFQTILIQVAETNYMRLIAALAVIIPLVLTMYTYIDQVIFDSKRSLLAIQNYQLGGDFPFGAYFLSYAGVAQFDTFMITLFTYITMAVVWSFTTDLQPVLVAGRRK